MSSPSLFYISIQSLLKSWTALQLAVVNGFGGPQSNEKAQWLVDVIEEYFNTNSQLETDEIEDYLAEIINAEFDIVLEDGSLQLIAKELREIYMLWSQNQHVELKNKIQKFPQANLQDSSCDKSKAAEEDEELNEAMEEVEIIKSPPRNQPDEDGWITVSKSKKNKS